ncbi:MAG TPA: TonB-dependent receptor, partial [Stenomitos sp.]
MKQRSTMRYGAMLLGTAIALGIGLSPATANTPDTTTKLAATPSPPVTALPDDEEEAVPVEATPTSAAEIAILSPSANAVLERPATTLTIQYPLNANVEVRINGKLGDRGLIGRTETNKTTQRVTETWYGLTLDQGPNLITVHRIGESKPAASVQIQVSGMPDQIKLKTLETRIPADGRSTATVEGMLLDKDGNLSNWNAMVTLEASAGEFTGADAQPDTPGFQVESNHGKFSAALRSTTQAQQVRVRAQSGTLEAYYQFQFDTLIRPTPLIAGVVDFRLGARGTNFYNRFQDFLPVDRNNSTILDAKGAAFGTASIGEWLITGAYNSDRPLNQDADGNSGLMGVTDTPELQYPVTGDNSTSERVAPSQDSLYLRIERTSPVAHAGTDSFMWGDFTTDEFATTAQEFTAQNRTLHGFKANYNWGGLQLSALYSNTVQGVQRDTIAPDGTSGFYFLSQRPVIDGSEVIMLELQDLRRPGTIVDVQQLVRGVDYTIDYDRGSLLFSQPILRTATAPDGTPLVRTIVATYQYDSGGASTSIMAGRARYHFSRKPGEESWLGGTYWREDQGNRLFELYGVDGTVALGKTGHVTVEYAHS